MTPDCVKASADELKTFAKDAKGKFAPDPDANVDPDHPENKGKITEWEAAWNVTNAIQVRIVVHHLKSLRSVEHVCKLV